MSDGEYGEEEIYGELEPDFEAQEEEDFEAQEEGAEVVEAAEQDKQSEEDLLSEEEAEEDAEEEFAEAEAEEAEDLEAAETKSETTARAAAPRRATSQRTRVDPLARYSQTPKTKVVVADEDRKTSAYLQKAEMTRVLAIRAEQLSKNPTVFVTAGLAGAKTAHEIARLELLAKRCPLIIERRIGTTDMGEDIVERWKVNEMSLGFHNI